MGWLVYPPLVVFLHKLKIKQNIMGLSRCTEHIYLCGLKCTILHTCHAVPSEFDRPDFHFFGFSCQTEIVLCL